MNKYLLPALALVIGIGSSNAQSKVQSDKKSKDESITIRKKAGSDEKVTIVIDGDNITVNGKPLSELKDSDIEVLRKKELTGRLLPRLKENLIMPRGSLKMFGDELPAGNRAFLGVTSGKNDKGAVILSVEKESPAEKAGLKKDDIITKVGDTKIEDGGQLFEAVGKHNPEEKVTITYLRDGKEATATATLGKTRNTGVRSFSFGDMGDLGELNGKLKGLEELRQLPRMNGDFDFNGRNFNFDYLRKPRIGLEIQDVEEGKGVKVLDVDSETPAAKAGLQKDDVITDVDGKTINGVDDLKTSLKNLKEGDSIKITYKRAGQSKTAELKLPKKLKTAEL